MDRRIPSVVLWLAVLTLLAGVRAYFTIFTGFSAYDDEGTLMLSVKQYMGGLKIYDQIFSVYGPVYYFYNAVIRTLTLTPVTHDVTRMTSLVVWLVCTLLSAWIALRLTKSLFAAGVTHFLVSLLIFFQYEPGHPQELVLLLLLILASMPLSVGSHSRALKTMCAVGLLSGGLLFVKVNIAAYVIGALGLAFLACGPRSRIARLLGWACAAGCVLFPLILMRAHLHSSWAKVYCGIEVASIAAAAICLLGTRREAELTWRHLVVGAGAFVVSCGTVLLVLTAQGTSLWATFDSTVLTPSQIFVENPAFFVPPPLIGLSPLWALVGLACCIWAVMSKPVPGSPSWRRLMQGKLILAVVVMGVSVVRPLRLLALATPFTWLLVFGTDKGEAKWQDFPRKWLCILTVLQTLYAYPVAGSQNSLVQVLLVITMAISAGDAWTWLTHRINPSSEASLSELKSGVTPASLGISGERLTVAGLCLIALLYGGLGARAMGHYRSLPSLDLPGAHRIHLAASERDAFHWLAANLKANCDAFESLPGLASLNFWSGLYPLTGWNSDAWTFCLTPRQQRTVAAALEPHPRACIVENPELARFWRLTDQKAATLPLVQYIRNEFHTVGSIDGYNLMVRNGREAVQLARN